MVDGLHAVDLIAQCIEEIKKTDLLLRTSAGTTTSSSTNALSIKGKTVDDSGIGDGKVLAYQASSDTIVYSSAGAGAGDMQKANYDVTATGSKVDTALNAEKLNNHTEAQVQTHAPASHGNEAHGWAFVTQTEIDTHAGLTTGIHGVGLGTISKVGDIAVDANLSAAGQDAITKRHAETHTLGSHSTKAHSELTGVGADDHHPQAHTVASHSTKAHSELTGVGADDHHRQYNLVDEATWLRNYALPRGIWTKVQAGAVVTKTAGKFDATRIAYGCSVLYVNGVYCLWYAGTNGTYRIGYKTSVDGITWTDYWGAGTDGSVLDVGAAGKFDDTHVMCPSVLFDGTTYHMWYVGYHTCYQIGYATSSDGVTWTRQNGGDAVLTVGAGGTWDALNLLWPCVFKFGKELFMQYNGSNGVWKLGCAFCKSGDGITWTKYSGNPTVTVGAAGTWDVTYIAAPGAYYESGVFYAVYSGYSSLIGDYQLGLALSDNMQVFTKYDANPIFAASGVAGDWDHWKEAPCIIRVGNTFKMWYMGASQGADADGIGLATISI